MIHRFTLLLGLAVALLSMPASVRAVVTIEINRGVERPVQIAVVPFRWGFQPQGERLAVGQVVDQDLRMTGRFQGLDARLLADLGLDRVSAEDLQPEVWRQLDVDYVVVGSVDVSGTQPYIQFRLFDVVRRDAGRPGQAIQLLGQRVQVGTGGLRRAAHMVSDLIYERLTGEPGIFTTRLAYITRQHGDGGYVLNISDLDGMNSEARVRSRRPMMSPAWSEDGSRIAFVSFENEAAEIYALEVASGELTRLAAYPGVNSAPAFSPDGRRLALALARGTDNIDIYVLELASGALTRITQNLAIDTEPVWTPDGRELYFTSDRSGGPQIYRVDADGGRAVRVTFEGSYNARPRLSPDGLQLAMVHRAGQAYRIAVQDLRTGALRVVSEGTLDESPSFSPGGGWIAYAGQDPDRRDGQILGIVRADGGPGFNIRLPGGDVREPAWAPYAVAHGSRARSTSERGGR